MTSAQVFYMASRDFRRSDKQAAFDEELGNTEPDSLLCAADIQERLRISRAKAYRLMQRNVLPTVRIDGSIRVPQRALAVWIKQHTQYPVQAVAHDLPTDSVLTKAL